MDMEMMYVTKKGLGLNQVTENMKMDNHVVVEGNVLTFERSRHPQLVGKQIILEMLPANENSAAEDITKALLPVVFSLGANLSVEVCPVREHKVTVNGVVVADFMDERDAENYAHSLRHRAKFEGKEIVRMNKGEVAETYS